VDFGLPRALGSYDALLEDPNIDAIYIPLPNGLHAHWTIRAAEHGKHVLCEKPFTANAAEAVEVAAAAARTGMRIMEGFMWRFHPQHIRARAMIDAGEIGAVRAVRGAFSFPLDRKQNVRWAKDLEGGSVMDIGCYPISGARYYFGAEPTRAFARGEIDPEYGVDVRTAGVLEFPAGRALFDCAFDLPFRCDLEVVGERRTIQFPRSWLPDEEALLIVDGQAERLQQTNQYVEMFDHFSRAILDGTAPRFAPEDAVRQMRAIDAVRRSIALGAPVDVADN